MLMFLLKQLRKLASSLLNTARKITGRDDLQVDMVSERILVVNAIRDSRTCPFCATMDGRRIKMPLLASRNFLIEYGNLSKPSGWGKRNLLPPYHPNCRCDIEVQRG
jgi:hypothetical protein